MKFKLLESRALYHLLVVIGLLFLGNCLALYLKFYANGMDSKITRLLIKLFDFNREVNLPTYFSSLLLLANAILLALIGYQYKALNKNFWQWLGLSAIFGFLALDEMVQIHEHVRAPTEALLNTTGIAYFAWFIPYLLIMFILAIIYFKFMARLQIRILKLFIFSAVLYISGAVVVEAISGMHAEVHGEQTLTYAILYTFEELLEMLGLAVFFYALLCYITSHFKNFKVKFKETRKVIME